VGNAPIIVQERLWQEPVETRRFAVCCLRATRPPMAFKGLHHRGFVDGYTIYAIANSYTFEWVEPGQQPIRRVMY
jgi:hypothetical protein